MKNAGKILLASMVTLIVGFGIFMVGFAMADFQLENVSSVKYSQKDYSSLQEITQIEVNDRNMAVDVVPSPDSQVHITYYENKNNTYQISENNGRLQVYKNVKRASNWLSFGVNLQRVHLTIQIPANFAGSIDLSSTNSKIWVSGVSAKDLTINTTNGVIDIEQLAVAENLVCDTTNAKIGLDQVSAASVTVTATNGVLELEEIAAGDTIKARTTNGKIEVSDLSFGKLLNLQTTNGKIEGDLNERMADCKITAKTTNGSNSLQNTQAGSKTMIITTTNGKIDVEFNLY